MVRSAYILLIALCLSGCRFFGANSTFYPKIIFSLSSPFIFAQTYLRTSTDQSFEITNTGDEEATDLSGTLSSPHFIFKGGTYPGTGGTCGTSLGIKDTCLIVVSFTPQTSGSLSDELVITYKPAPLFGSQSVSMSLLGEALQGASLSISDGSVYDYGRVTINTTSNKTFTLTNSGDATATSITVATSPSTPFSIPGSFPGGGTCSNTLAAGSSCTFIVQFAPTAFAIPTDSVSISYHDGGSTNSTSRSFTGRGVGASGYLDTTFGSQGLATHSIGSSQDVSYESYIQPDHKTLLVGYSNLGLGIQSIAIARISTDGKLLDTSFNTDGIATATNLYAPSVFSTDGSIRLLSSSRWFTITSDGNVTTPFFGPDLTHSSRTKMALQSNGKMLLLGGGSPIRESSMMALARFNADNTLDTSFATYGMTEYAAGASDNTYSFIKTYDHGQGERIYAGGGFDNTFGIERIKSDGTLDTSFFSSGALFKTITTSVSALSGNYISNIVFNTAGDLIATGLSYFDFSVPLSGSTLGAAGLFISSDGAFLSAYNYNTSNQSSAASPYASTLMSDGKVALTGTRNSTLLVTKILEDASAIDTTFATLGYFVTTLGIKNAVGNQIHSDGKFLVVTGYGTQGLGQDFAAMRLIGDSGVLDTSFNTFGFNHINIFNYGDSRVTSLAVDSSGRTWGFGAAFEGLNYAAAVVRYNTGGILDTSFHTDGVVTHSFGTAALTNGIKGILRSNGGVFLAGLIDTTGRILALNSDGNPDTSFNTSGLSVALTTAGLVNAITVQTDGKPVVAGRTANDFWAARVTTAGQLDVQFKTVGIAVYTKGANEAINAITIDGNRIVASGYSVGGDSDYAVLRILSNGNIDTSFATTGILTVSVHTGNDRAFSIIAFSDGSYLASGISFEGKNKLGFVKVLSDGTLDTTFNTIGILHRSFGANSFNTSFAPNAVLETNGQVIAGFSGDSAPHAYGLLRILSSGLLDSTFGTSGYLLTSVAGTAGSATALARAEDGTLCIGGYAYKAATHRNFAIIKIWP